ncbi:MAG TPA: cyclodeaminase/cyclohydrolase family protein, partial [bacterium]
MEYHLSGKAHEGSLFDFLTALSDATPTPGGGSVAALQGALGT